MQTAFIIDSTYLKTQYPGYIESNIDDNSLESFILISQDVNLQELIGYTMYNFIITNLISNPTGASMSTQYQFLLTQYIRPVVSLWTIYNAYPTLLFKATNKAIVTKFSDESREVGIRELEYLRNQVRNNAQFYESRVREYILNNTTFFNEYWSTNGVNRIRPASQVYAGNLYLGPSIYRCIDNTAINLKW